MTTYSAMSKPAVLTIAELNKIDQLSFDKANKILSEAQAYLRCFDCDLAVRRAQAGRDLLDVPVVREDIDVMDRLVEGRVAHCAAGDVGQWRDLL